MTDASLEGHHVGMSASPCSSLARDLTPSSESPGAQLVQPLTPPSSMDSQGRDFWLAFPGNS
jgi:hypothetical protein